MAHSESATFFRACFAAFPYIFKNSKSKIIDFGSLDINGGPHLEIDASYTGVDIGPGPNVDLVCPAQEVGFPSHSFDAAISSECLEHNPFWRETLFQMARLTKSGGVVIWTCAGIGRAVHGVSFSPDQGFSAPYIANSSNYYSNVDARSAEKALNHMGWYDDYVFFENFKSHDTYFVGIRTNSNLENLEVFKTLKQELMRTYGDVQNWKLRRILYRGRMRWLVEKYFDLVRFVKVVFTADQKIFRTRRKLRKWLSVE